MQLPRARHGDQALRLSSLDPRRLPLALRIGVCLLAALVAAVLSVSSISLVPPHIKPRALVVAGASTHVAVDLPQAKIGDSRAKVEDLDTLGRRAVLLGNLVSSEPVLQYIGRRAGVDPQQIAAVTKITANVPTVMTEPDTERRAHDIAVSHLPFRIEVQPSQSLPSFNVYVQAPSVAQAERLADATVPGLRAYLRDLALRKGDDPAAGVQLTQVGHARGGVISGRAKPMIAALAFMLVLALSSLLLLRGPRERRGRTATRPEPSAPPQSPAARPRVTRPAASGGRFALSSETLSPAVAVAPAPAAGVVLPGLPLHQARGAAAAMSRRVAAHAGDWPRTTRLLPWTIAAMMAVVWLVPFNSIVLQASLPIDLKFDRLVLPVVVGVWLIAIAIGDQHAPRLRSTPVHVALGAVVVLACVSLLLDAGYLNQTLELQTGIKKLTLLVSYLSLFVVVASAIRRTEVNAFIIFTLVLAVICALGTLWEYRFQYNVFYGLSDKLLPGIFQVTTQAESSAYDDIGRRLVKGPGEIPLEDVGMMVMALPIALVGVLHATRRRGRILYGLAACLLLAAMVSTNRKSAFMAPVAVVLTLAYFRRRELLKLAPLLLVLLVAIHGLAPGALGSVAFQLRGDQLGVNTVGDRSSDYDAVRPDLWTHLAFGRGYGTYEHTSYRILDMELLHEIVEVGVLGMAAYVLMIAAVVAVARAPIRARRPRDGPVALAVAAAAIAFLVVSTLFDVMSFPHCPYIFLWLAALLIVAVAPPEHGPGPRALGEEAAWSS
jgi:hypothetical protein